MTYGIAWMLITSKGDGGLVLLLYINLPTESATRINQAFKTSNNVNVRILQPAPFMPLSN